MGGGGKRLGVTRTRKASDYAVQPSDVRDVATLAFPSRRQKQKRKDRIPLSDEARAYVERLLERQAVRATGYLFPAGDLNSPDPERGPIRQERLNEMLHDAETEAEIPHVRGRSWHALKRAFATILDSATASEQSGTRRTTLENVYRQERWDVKLGALDQLAARRRGAS
jgi:hypothetical protein